MRYVKFDQVAQIVKDAKADAELSKETAGENKELLQIAKGALTEIRQIEISISQLREADVVEVKYGAWYPVNAYKCDLCEHIVEMESRYCPNCGAKMKYDEED